jgi:hypothetical protein
MDLKWTDLLPSVERFLQAWQIVRVCPDKINGSKEQISFNLLTLTVVLVVFILARNIVAGAEHSLASDLFSTVVSSVVVFACGFICLLQDSSENGLDRARKWGLFLVMLWVVSLIAAILIDGIATWNHVTPPTSIGIDAIFLPGTLPAFAKDGLRALFFGLVALAFMIWKTRKMDPQFRVRGKCAIGTVLVGLFVNTILLQLFVYSNFF